MQQIILLQSLLLAQHVSGTTMPIIRSSRVLYRWSLPVVFGALVSSCRYGVELRVMCPVCGLLLQQQPANRTHNHILFPHCIYCVISASLTTAVMIRDIQISQEVWTSGISIKSRYAATASRGQARVLKILLHVSNKANVISPYAGVARSENCCGVEVIGLMWFSTGEGNLALPFPVSLTELSTRH